MPYQPGIPTGTIPLNQDYLNIQGNFNSLNTQFNVDHVPLTSTSGTPPNGYHTNIHMVPNSTVATNPPNNYPPVTPTANSGYGQLWSSQSNDGINVDETLFFLTGGNRNLQLTRNFTPVAANNGYTFIPGGLILQWGRVTGLSGSWPTTPQVLSFASANINFPTACFSVTTNFIGPTSSSTGEITINSVSTANFTWQFSGSSSATFGGFYWWALGI